MVRSRARVLRFSNDRLLAYGPKPFCCPICHCYIERMGDVVGHISECHPGSWFDRWLKACCFVVRVDR